MIVKVHYVQFGRRHVVDHAIPDTDKATLEAAVDYFEAQRGTVLAIYAQDGTRLFKSAVEEHEVR